MNNTDTAFKKAIALESTIALLKQKAWSKDNVEAI